MKKNRIETGETEQPVTGILNKKWMVVKPKLPYDKFVIAPKGWKCTCNKNDEHYKKNGCACHVGNMSGLSDGWEKEEVAEHIVRLHNKSLED